VPTAYFILYRRKEAAIKDSTDAPKTILQ